LQHRQIILASMGNASDNEEEHAAHPEARASRKKYRAERRARILQLFGPVCMVLREEHFHRHESAKHEENNVIVPVEESKSPVEPTAEQVTTDEDAVPTDNDYDIEEGKAPVEEEIIYDDDLYAEESDFVEIPCGLNGLETRLVPCLCVICLQQYEVGEEIVWASNPDCEHAFHSNCCERWLIKQRGGPLCPCCRRDFVIDPFDLEAPSHEEEEEANLE